MSRGTTNAKQELEIELQTIGVGVKCAELHYFPNSLWKTYEETPPPDKHLELSVGHTQEEFDSFMNELDFMYDSSYGGQELHGTIWLQDGTWMERGEYDGKEWWHRVSMPKIPYYLQNQLQA